MRSNACCVGVILLSNLPSAAADGPEVATLKSCPTKAVDLPGQLDELKSAVVRVERGSSSGSGFIISEDGFVLTAAHVVSGEGDLNVSFSDGTSAPAELLRMNPSADLALLKLDAINQPCLPVSTERPPTGVDLFVIGSPGGAALDHSVSKGIVSGFRAVGDIAILQTDAAINAGNSGGPVLAADGTVIGLVSFKGAGIGVEGLGFAIGSEVFGDKLYFQMGDATDAEVSSWVFETDAGALAQQRPPTVSSTVTWEGDRPTLVDDKKACRKVKTVVDDYSGKISSHSFIGKHGFQIRKDADGTTASWTFRLDDEGKKVLSGLLNDVVIEAKLESGTEVKMRPISMDAHYVSGFSNVWLTLALETALSDEALLALASSPVAKLRAVRGGKPVAGYVRKPERAQQVFQCLANQPSIARQD